MTVWQIAIETSMRQGSVALLDEDRTVRQTLLPGDRRTAQTLSPAVAELLSSLPDARRSIKFVSVAAGPGSFTGLRIGVTAAKTLAYALRCPVVPCDTLAAIIARTRDACPEAEVIDAAIDAFRGQVFCRRESRSGEVRVASQALDRERWLGSFSPGGAATGGAASGGGEQTILASGNAWARIAAVPAGVRLAPEQLWHPTAATIGMLGWRAHQQGASIEPMRLRPDYLRESAAEEKAAQRTESTTGSTPG